MVTISLSADIVLTYRGVLLLAMTLQDISLSVTDVHASFLPRQQQALFYYRHWAQILEWSFVFRPHNMWLYGIYSAPAVVTPFPISLSRDRAKCQAMALKERSSEGQDEEGGSREKGTEWNLLETNTHEHCSCLGGTSSVMGGKHGSKTCRWNAHTFSLRVINEMSHLCIFRQQGRFFFFVE